MRRLRLPLLILILAALGAYSAAQSPPAKSGAGQSGATESGAASEELPAFQPSEQVSADVAVAFPVDI